MADKIIFKKSVNTSVQIGDKLYYSQFPGTYDNDGNFTPSGDPIGLTEYGTITEVGDKFVKVTLEPTGIYCSATSPINLSGYA